MNARALACWVFLAATPLARPAVQAEGFSQRYNAEMAENAAVQADFFARYPDLQDERDIVAAAARALAAQGWEPPDVEAAANLLAAETRELLAQRSPQDWQRRAVSLFPELGAAGSPFNRLFLEHYRELKQTSPQFMEEPSWPVLLARRCADELQTKPGTPAVSAAKKSGSPSPDPSRATARDRVSPGPAAVSSMPELTPRRAGFWASLLCLLLLLPTIALPAGWILRRRSALAGRDEPRRIWQEALEPAVWTYIGAAGLALIRTFAANADQRFFDRFGITLLVSVLAGAAFAVPAYGLALASVWLLRHHTLKEDENHGNKCRSMLPAFRGRVLK